MRVTSLFVLLLIAACTLQCVSSFELESQSEEFAPEWVEPAFVDVDSEEAVQMDADADAEADAETETETETEADAEAEAESAVTGATCPDTYYYGSSSQLSLAQVVACAKAAGFSGDLLISFVSMAWQESGFCPGAIESGSGACSHIKSGCGGGRANAEGILQEGTGGQCPPTGGAFGLNGYNPSSCSSYKAHGWGGVYFNPSCAFKWAKVYYNIHGYAFWGSYLSGAYCKYAPAGFRGTGKKVCTGNGQNQAHLPWGTVCPKNKC